MVDELKFPRDYGELLWKYVFWCSPYGTQHLFCWLILVISGQSLTSNGPVIDNRDLNLVFGHAEATPLKMILLQSHQIHNRIFLAVSPGMATV
ncbi:hypothetical protein TNCV_4143511 [Trichonephila clavipes]|nr:hypothetical protein TNCV_4143511 [Trichonephila clavipes]